MPQKKKRQLKLFCDFSSSSSHSAIACHETPAMPTITNHAGQGDDAHTRERCCPSQHTLFYVSKLTFSDVLDCDDDRSTTIIWRHRVSARLPSCRNVDEAPGRTLEYWLKHVRLSGLPLKADMTTSIIVSSTQACRRVWRTVFAHSQIFFSRSLKKYVWKL